jgi:hypothetical protein
LVAFANSVQPGQQVAEDQEVEMELFSDPQKARQWLLAGNSLKDNAESS